MTVYMFVDTETGGITTDYSLLTLGVAFTNHHYEVLSQRLFNFKLLDVKVTPYALRLNKIDVSQVDQNTDTYHDAGEYIDALVKEFEMSGPVILAGWNVQFDAKFLSEYVGNKLPYRMLDVQSVYRFLFPKQNASLQKAAEYLGISIVPDHNAMTDTLVTVGVAKKLHEMVVLS